MNTPVIDFIKKYRNSGSARFHMPGHKGINFTGHEEGDITEITGTGSAFDYTGIVSQSEANASSLFGFGKTYYCTEGSTQCIKAMIYLAKQAALLSGRDGSIIMASRNVHKAFVFACGQNDVDVIWLDGSLTPEKAEKSLENIDKKPFALYVTSPDYYGKTVDITGLSEVCNRYGIMLLVDNAHGAYLKFLSPSLHPVSLGAFMSADSAHKTLPVLTGGAYLQLSDKVPEEISGMAKAALAMFCSTSPSWLILQSLDGCNAYLANGYEKKLAEFTAKLNNLKNKLTIAGWNVLSSDPLRLVIDTRSKGYTGYEVYEILEEKQIQGEFADFEHLVLMLTPENTDNELKRLENALLSIPSSGKIPDTAPSVLKLPKKVMPIRQALLSVWEKVDADKAVGRICAFPVSPFPPEVPIVISGEEIDQNTVSLMKAYGIENVFVVKK